MEKLIQEIEEKLILLKDELKKLSDENKELKEENEGYNEFMKKVFLDVKNELEAELILEEKIVGKTIKN